MADEMWWPNGDEIKRRFKTAGFQNAHDLADAATKAGRENVSESFVLKAMRGERSGKARLMQVALPLACDLEDIASKEPLPLNDDEPPSDTDDSLDFGADNAAGIPGTPSPLGQCRYLEFTYEGKDPSRAIRDLEQVLRLHRADSVKVTIREIEP
jgi:hypothetical protein